MRVFLNVGFALLVSAINNISLVSASDCEEVTESGLANCYTGILGNFIEDPHTNKVWYVSYTIKGELLKSEAEDIEVCSVGTAGYTLYDINELHENPKEIGRSSGSSLNCETGRYFGDPIVESRAVDGQLRFKTRPFHVDKTIYPSIQWFSKNNFGPEDLIQKQESHFYTTFQPAMEILDVKIPGKPSEEVVVFFKDSGDVNRINRSIKHEFEHPPFYSSNGCWLVVPSSDIVVRSYNQPTPPPENYRNTDFVQVKSQSLTIYSLDESQGKLDGYQCFTPGWRNVTRSDILEKKPDPLGNKRFIENTVLTGADYSAYSPLDDPNKLHIVYQPGFESDSCYPDQASCEHSPNERNLVGDLYYAVFRRDASDDMEPKIVLVPELSANITKECSIKGWEHSPSFSRDKSRLFFLAMSERGDDSSKNHLYVVNTEVIDENFRCISKGKSKNVINITGEFELSRTPNFDYPILTYSLSPDLERIAIVFEERGESVVRFFKFDKEKNEIRYEYPETIRGIGKIYDISSEGVLSNDHGFPIYHVIHSQLNHPVSISRCYFTKARFVCGDRYSPIHTTSYGREIDSSLANRASVQRMAVRRSPNPNIDLKLNPTIDVFILKPRFSNGRAIVSVHGGPNEAWDGRFSPRDYRLAELGYTIYMPNPAGSTGYGHEFTSISAGNWGTIISNDIKDVIDKVDEIGDHKKLYLMGFSFGGYMVNWIQTGSDSELREKIDAYIAVSGFFDIKEFASSTEQLWFPEHQLGCSHPESLRDLRCELNVLSNQIPEHVEYCKGFPQPVCKAEYVCPPIEKLPVPGSETILISQNPECRKEVLGPDSKPTLFISGGGDQRIPFVYNVQPMLNAYRETCAPHTMQREGHFGHDVPGHRAKNQGNLIDRWLQDVESCDARKEEGKFRTVADYLNCEYQSDPGGKHLKYNPYAIDRASKKFVFDNPVCYPEISGMLDDVSEASCFEEGASWNEPHLHNNCMNEDKPSQRKSQLSWTDLRM